MGHEEPVKSDASPAENYERVGVPAMFAHWVPEILGLVEPKPGERALDVACGTGIVARSMAAQVGQTGHCSRL